MRKKFFPVLYLIGIAVFAYLIWDFGLDKIIVNIEKTGWWFLPVIGIWGVVYLLNSAGWYIILGEYRKKVAFWKIFGISLGGFAINYITPFINLGGEPYRIYSLKFYTGLSKSVSSVTLYRMLHIISHLLFWLAIIPVTFFIIPLNSRLVVILIVLFIVIFSMVLFVFSRHKLGIYESLTRIFLRLKFLKFINRKLEKNRNSITEIDEQIKDLYLNRKKLFYVVLGCEFLARILAAFEFYFIFRSIGTDISILQALYIHGASSLFLNILFFMPMELGTREGSLYLALKTFIPDASVGIYIALVNRIRELFWIFIGLLFIQINKRYLMKEEVLIRNNFEQAK
ncbi:MAG: lysylphosphatidylglycerol synthase transmembrane domain-containing protein [Ignavibacteriales bacterium]